MNWYPFIETARIGIDTASDALWQGNHEKAWAGVNLALRELYDLRKKLEDEDARNRNPSGGNAA